MYKPRALLREKHVTLTLSLRKDEEREGMNAKNAFILSPEDAEKVANLGNPQKCSQCEGKPTSQRLVSVGNGVYSAYYCKKHTVEITESIERNRMKLCIDCKWFKPNPWPLEYPNLLSYCTHPNYLSPVDGGPYRSALDVREKNCGIRMAESWEKKEIEQNDPDPYP